MARRRILVVDDNAAAASALELGLRVLGYDVAIAHDGATALELVARFEPVVALIDLSLPDFDGCHLATRLQAVRPMRLIAITGYGERADRQRSRAAGFKEHLLKPVELTAVQAAIEG
jgi:CheY-like chemotaxis protein